MLRRYAYAVYKVEKKWLRKPNAIKIDSKFIPNDDKKTVSTKKN